MILAIGSALLIVGPRYLPAPEVSMITMLEVVAAPVMVWAVIGEDPGLRSMIGGAVIFAALVVHTLWRWRRAGKRVGLKAEAQMFGTWKAEKAVQALVDEAQALADKLASAKPHFVESYAAEAQVWAVRHMAEGVDLANVLDWTPADAARFAKSAATRIAALRKARDYGPSDGLTIWLHTARAVSEPRILPPLRAIWARLGRVGPNAASMAEDLLQEAGLPAGGAWVVPKGLGVEG